MGKDMLEGGNFHHIILVSWESPADVAFQILLPKDRNIEDVLLKVCEETPVGFLAPDLERPPDVLEEMHMTQLDDDAREDVSGCHPDGFVIVTGDGDERVVRILELLEVLHPGLKALGGSEEADRDIVRQVVDAVEERNLLLVALHGYVLAVHNEGAPESLPVAVPGGDVIVVGELLKLRNKARIRPIEASVDSRSERSDTRTLEVEVEERFCLFPAMIHAEPAPAIIAQVSLQSIAGAFPPGVEASTGFAGNAVASGSPFLRVNMFKVGKVAS